ncbi:MAG: fused MFS/spermidine synthase [Solobacterium sp.]|nr:fused MFS/spermidine synthase [Solobacterium sp.]
MPMQSVRNVYRSEYNGSEVVVYEVDEVVQSMSFTDEEKRNDLVLEYTQCMCDAAEKKNECRDMLVIGSAGYSIPKYMISRHADVRMDVVDLDETAEETAREYFYLNELYATYGTERLATITAEGREYMETCGKQYDIIMLDAFIGELPAFSLFTAEGLAAEKKCLKKGGWIIANLPGMIETEDFPLTYDFVHTFAQKFSFVSLLRQESFSSEDECNYIVIASDEPVMFEDQLYFDAQWGNTLEDADIPFLLREYE